MKENSEELPEMAELGKLARLQSQMQRTGQEVNREGSLEVGWGIAVLCCGLTPYFNALVMKSGWFSGWTSWIAFLPLIGAAFAPYAVPRMIKRFITWPRTGYVANPNDMKLIQLVMLMVFGCALGIGIVQVILLVVQAQETFGQPGAHSDLHKSTLRGITLVASASLAMYLGRKVIRKRPPLPAAYDAVLIAQGLKQTAAGRKIHRGVRCTLVVVFLGVPMLVFGIAFGLMYWSKGLMRLTEIHWSELGMPSFLVATNALLYLMGSGVMLKRHRWKWLVLAVMLVMPILVAPAIPYPATKPELTTILTPLPPMFLCIGSVWFLSGAITLIVFMRQNAPAAAETP